MPKNRTNTGLMPFYKSHFKLTFRVHLVFGKTAGSDKSPRHFLKYVIIAQISTNPVGTQFQQRQITAIANISSDDASKILKNIPYTS